MAFIHYSDMHIQHHLYPKYVCTIKPIYINDQTIALWSSAHTHTHTHSDTHTHTHTYTHNDTQTRTHTVTHTHTQSDTHTHTQWHIHTVTCTHTNSDSHAALRLLPPPPFNPSPHTHTQISNWILTSCQHHRSPQDDQTPSLSWADQA